MKCTKFLFCCIYVIQRFLSLSFPKARWLSVSKPPSCIHYWGSTSSPPLECVYFKEPVAEPSESLVAEPVEATFYNYYQKSAYKAAVISSSAKAPTLNTAGVAKMPFSNGIPLASSPPRFSCRLTMTITNMDSKAVKPI